jgi:hypothetical protein
MRSLIVVTLVLVLSAASALAQESLTPRQRAEKFLQLLADKGSGPAFDLLFDGSAIPAEKPQAVDGLKRQTDAALPLYGKILDFELVTEKPFGGSVVLLTYIQRLEKNPLVWRFFFYKPHNRWFLANVLINDQLQGLPE